MILTWDMQADSFLCMSVKVDFYFSRLYRKKKSWKEKRQKDPSWRLSDVFHKLKTDSKVKVRTVVDRIFQIVKMERKDIVLHIFLT